MKNKLFSSGLLLLGCLTLCIAESVFDSEEANKIKDTVKNITQLNPRQIVQIDKWMNNCESQIGPAEWKKIEGIPTRIYPCMRRYLKPKVAQEEIEDSVARGDLDLVFKKYCGRKEKILHCLFQELENVKPCMDDTQLENLNITENAIDAGVEFICSESGDKIALFMAENGRECMKEKEVGIKDCLNKYFADVSKISNIRHMQFDHLFISKDTCNNFTSVHKCVVDVTSSCEDPTPSNILDSLMTQALKRTPCADTSGSLNIFSLFIGQLLHPYMLTVLVGTLTATHILL